MKIIRTSYDRPGPAREEIIADTADTATALAILLDNGTRLNISELYSGQEDGSSGLNLNASSGRLVVVPVNTNTLDIRAEAFARQKKAEKP